MCSAAAEQAPPSPQPWHHLPDGTFRNPPGSSAGDAGFGDMAAFFWRRARAGLPQVPAGHVVPQEEAVADFRATAGSDTVTWLGHAGFLLRLGTTTLLTDPFLSRVAGPRGFGPERYVEPGLPLAELPPIDVLMVSHNHYDHLDAETIAALPNKGRVEVVVPLGLGAFFRSRGYRRVHELDWHQSVSVRGAQIELVPAIHFSRRGAFDRNRTLWGGFAIRASGWRIFHSGDTGYGPVFRDIGARSGPFDLGLVAIGAYDPRSIMRAVHVDPEEAVQLADDVRARAVIGMHWGTVELTDEPPFEPPQRFRAAAAAAGWPPGRADVMRIGETRRLTRLFGAQDREAAPELVPAPE